MDEPSDDRRWQARRKFWFPSGILVDRRGEVERRSGAERRRTVGASLPQGIAAERRVGDRRGAAERRDIERRSGARRPSDHRGRSARDGGLAGN
jgi:hypothetical protein